jgi:glutamyl-tRNA synthetase
MLNFLALLGWSPGGDVEIMSVPEMIERFARDGLSKKAAIFDIQKLEWMNGQHMAAMSGAELAPFATRAIVAAGLATEAELTARGDWFLTLLDLLKVRARTLDELARQAAPYLRSQIEYDADAVAKQWKDRPATRDLLSAVRDSLASTDPWEPDVMEASLRGLAERRSTGAGKLFQPLRVALTGSAASPGIFDVLKLLGRERSLERIDAAVAFMA